MHVTLLAVSGCPHLPVLEERLAEALIGLPAVTVSRQVIATEDDAARGGMHGSPTILIDGLDPFAGPGQQPPPVTAQPARAGWTRWDGPAGAG